MLSTSLKEVGWSSVDVFLLIAAWSKSGSQFLLEIKPEFAQREQENLEVTPALESSSLASWGALIWKVGSRLPRRTRTHNSKPILWTVGVARNGVCGLK